MTAEQTAIRRPDIPIWHLQTSDQFRTACGLGILDTAAMTQVRPVKHTDPADRCRTCWPTKENTK